MKDFLLHLLMFRRACIDRKTEVADGNQEPSLMEDIFQGPV